MHTCNGVVRALAFGHMTKQPPSTADHVTLQTCARVGLSGILHSASLRKQGSAASGWPTVNNTVSPAIDPFRESL